MADEGVMEAGRRDLGLIEGCVGLLATSLSGEPAALRPVEERQMGASPVRPEARIEEAVRVGRRAVRGPPEGDALAEGLSRKLGLPEDMDVIA